MTTELFVVVDDRGQVVRIVGQEMLKEMIGRCESHILDTLARYGVYQMADGHVERLH